MIRLWDNTMQVISFSEARESFPAGLDRVEADADVTLITCCDPFEGIGKPEPLRENLAGGRSRRIDAVHL